MDEKVMDQVRLLRNIAVKLNEQGDYDTERAILDIANTLSEQDAKLFANKEQIMELVGRTRQYETTILNLMEKVKLYEAQILGGNNA